MRSAILVLAVFCLQSGAHAATFDGYVSNDCDKSGFLTEVDKQFPCWHDVCAETMRLRSAKFRRQFWFDQTFYSGRDKHQRKAIEAMARSYGIFL